MGSRNLRVIAWPGMPDKAAVEIAAARLGHTASVEVVASNERLLEALNVGEPADLVFPSDYLVQVLASSDQLVVLDENRIPLERLTGWARETPFDPNNRYSVPFAYGTTGYICDARIPAGDSWQQLFAPPAGVRVGMLDEAREVVAAALLSAGWDANACSEEALAVATSVLESQRQVVAKFDSDDFTGQVSSGELAAHHAWSGPAAHAVRAAPKSLRYVVPSEGAVFWVTCGSVPTAARDPELSHALLAELMDPELAVLSTANAGLATTNIAARALLPATLREDTSLFPPEAVVARCTVLHDIGAQQRGVEETFSAVRAESAPAR